MRFKRLVSGIAALTVAMGTFATMTITASAAITQLLPTDYYAIKIVDESGTDLTKSELKPTTLEAISDTNTGKWNSITKGSKLSTDYLDDEYSSTNYVVSETPKGVKFSEEEISRFSSNQYTTNPFTETSLSVVDGGIAGTIQTKTYYWYTVIVRPANTSTLTVQKSINGAAPTAYTDLEINGFENGTYTYTEGEVAPQSTQIPIKFPRFVKGDDGDAYELNAVSGVGMNGTTRAGDRFRIDFNPKAFVDGLSGTGAVAANIIFNYNRYSRPSELPATAMLIDIVEDNDTNGTDDDTASNASRGDGECTINNLNAGVYYFVVTYKGKLQENMRPFATAAIDSSWNTGVVKAVTKESNKTATITVEADGDTQPAIDTVLVYKEETSTLNVNVTTSGAGNGATATVEGADNLVQGDSDMPNVTYSFPRYAVDGGKLYIANGIVENGRHTTITDETGEYNKTITGDTLRGINDSQYNVQILYSPHTVSGATGEFKKLTEYDGEDTSLEIDKGASNGKCDKITQSDTVSYKIETAGKHKLVVRYKGNVQADTVDFETSNLSYSDGWTEGIVTVTVKPADISSPDSGKTVAFIQGLSSGDGYIDSILDYSEEVKSELIITPTGQRTFDDPVEKAGPAYTAYMYLGTLKEGTDGIKFSIGVKVSKDGDEQDSGETVLTPELSGDGATIQFGVIAPEAYDVNPYAKELE